ncbi:aminopeptidase [Pedobacter yulinensis]|uniref:Carboxypeptidase Q n=1 Tax=Pedobacter yulinensis TaxID=2126353 RepID=A0A2T3HP46_9SPHI|nr:M28 family peptidase [Pedobacter yulinensis]PST84212.1 aminopeptidase [Pedobacter yulinensis]
MKKLTLLLLCLAAAAVQAQDNFSAAFEAINRDVQQNSRAYSSLKDATTTIGHRLTGSPQGAQAETYAYNLLKSYGYQVKYQPFSVESWARKTVNVQTGATPASLQPVKAVTLAHSPVSADVSAEVVDMGNGLEADYQANPDRARGKIALLYLGVLPGSPRGTKSLHRSEKTAIAIKYGAKGVIIINSVKDGVLLTGTASVTGKLIPIPAVCIGLEDGMKLKTALTTSKQFARLQMTNFSGMIKARNVIATLKGSLPKEKIVIGGHLDSWDLATGAIDNGIGSFAIIDMARSFSALKVKPRRTIEFVLFMGEEQGLLGSKAYVAAAEQAHELDNIRFMLNYDMTNDPKGFSTSRQEMRQLFTNWGGQAAAIDSSFKNLFHAGAGLHSDHQPFLLAGIPTGGGAGGKLPNNSGPYYHSDKDGFHLVDEQELKNTVRFSAMLLYGLAQTPEIPVRRLGDAELKPFLESQNLKEPLTIAGEWRWKD